MPYVTDYSGEWQYIDGVEIGQVQPQNPTRAVIKNVAMRRGEIGRNTLATLGGAAGGIAIQPTDQQFNFWVATLGGYTVMNGDLFIDSNQNLWTCLAVKQRADNAQGIAIVRMQK